MLYFSTNQAFSLYSEFNFNLSFDFEKNPEVFLNKYRGFGRRVLEYIVNRRHLEFVCLKNETIAEALGCAPRTVQRWTARFQEEGLFIKRQINQYAPNVYKMDIPRSSSFLLWFNSLSEEQQQLYIQHGIIFSKKGSVSFQYETVIQNYNYIKLDSCETIPVSRDYARARTRIQDFSPKKEEDVEQQLEIPGLVTKLPCPFTIAAQCRLSAFHEEVLRDLSVWLRKAKGMRNPFSVAMTMGIRLSQQKNLPIDWQFSYRLMDKYGVTKESETLIGKKPATPIKVAVAPKPAPVQPAIDRHTGFMGIVEMLSKRLRVRA